MQGKGEQSSSVSERISAQMSLVLGNIIQLIFIKMCISYLVNYSRNAGGNLVQGDLFIQPSAEETKRQKVR